MKQKRLAIIIGIIIILLSMNNQQKQYQKLAGETSSRSFTDSNLISGQTTTVSIAVTPGTSTYLAIDEKYPSGWTVVSASDSGDYTTTAGHIFWVVLSGATAKTYTYVINPNNNLGAQSFQGTIGFESSPEEPIGGTSIIEVISSSGCTQNSECPSTDCITGTCSEGTCEYNNIANGTSCPTGTCQSGTCVENETTCTPTIWLPLSDSACNAVTFQQTSNCNTSRTAVGTKINASCSNSNECSSGSKKCVGSVRYECADTDSDSFLDWKVMENCANGCTNGICNTVTTPSEPTCSFYQTLSDGECKTAGWLYLTIGAGVILMVFSGLRRR